MGDRIQTVAVDFDGVIHRYSRGWQDGTIYDEPMPGAIDGLKRLQERYAVFVFTSRDIEQVVPWLESQGKLPAVAYLDDRAVRFSTWDAVDDQLDGASR